MILNTLLLALSGVSPAEAGEEGGPGLALLAAKVLAVPYEGPQVIDRDEQHIRTRVRGGRSDNDREGKNKGETKHVGTLVGRTRPNRRQCTNAERWTLVHGQMSPRVRVPVVGRV